MSNWRDRLGRIGGGRGTGVRGFLRWWSGALATWLPARWRTLFGLAHDRLLLSMQNDDVRLLRQTQDHVTELATLPLPLEADALDRILPTSLASLPRWLLLPASQVLRRSLVFPVAAGDRLREVVGFEIDRQTPFTAAQVHYDVRALGRRGDQLDTELVAMPRTALDRALAQLGGAAGALAGADVVDAQGQAIGVNLLPAASRSRREDPLRRWNLVLVAVAVLALAAAGWQLLHNRRAAADAFAQKIEAQAGNARRVAAQRQQLASLVDGQAFLDRKRAELPPAIAVFDEVTRRLPDDSYLEKLSIEGNQLVLIGLSGNAPSLVGRLEGASIWRKPALSGALQTDPTTRRDRFSLTAELASGAPASSNPTAKPVDDARLP